MESSLYNTSVKLLMVILFSLPGCTAPQPKTDGTTWSPAASAVAQDTPTVALCELVHNPKQFDNKTVRTQAIFFVDSESQALYDPACDNKDTAMWAEYDVSYTFSDEEVKRKLSNLLCQTKPCPSGEAHVTIVGRFEDSNGNGYGHLNGYRFRFVIMRVEQAAIAPSQIKSQ